MHLLQEQALADIGVAEAIGRQANVGRVDRLHQIGGHDDHQLGLVALEAARLEQAAQDRDIAQARHLVDRVAGFVVEQARDHEALTRA
jgi:hypothetical protein